MIELYGLHIFMYWTVSIYFYICDRITINKGLWKSVKYTPIVKTIEDLNYKTFRSARWVAQNQIMTLMLLTLIPQKYVDKYYDNYHLYDMSYTEIAIRIIVGIQLCNMWFYLVHRMFHIKFLYKRIHYRHHMNTETVAVTALDANPLEHIISTMGIFFVCSTPIPRFYIRCFGVIIMTWWTCDAHSGYTKPSNRHEIHHKLHSYNYGQGLYLMDKLFGSHKE